MRYRRVGERAAIAALGLLLLTGLAFAAPSPVAERPLDETELALLAPPDLSSPGATLAALRSSVQSAYQILERAYDQHRTTPGLGISPEVAAQVAKANLYLRHATDTLDLSQVPAVNRERTGLETVLLFKEILDRLPVTPPDQVPDADDLKQADAAGAPITDWTIPYSDIHIVRMTDGPNAGQFLFSSQSVAGAFDFYNSIKEYAQRPDAGSDFFEFFTLTPGNLLPPRWYLWIEDLPLWIRTPVLGQAAWQWAGLFLTLVVLFGAWWLILRLRKRRRASSDKPRSTIGLALMPLLLILACAAALQAATELNISGFAFLVVNLGLHVIAYLAAAWIAYRMLLGLAEWIITSPRIDPHSIDASLLRIAARVLGLGAAIAILFYGATEIGLPLYGVIAGLGVGGLALGLAARPTLENLIGGLILYADRPVRVGDFCQFGDKLGTVEEIGLRSTRIRSADRTVITVPNAEFANMALINYTRRDRTLLRTTIGLRYETTQEQMQQVLDRIRKLLAEHPAIIHDTARVRFKELGDYALGVEVYAHMATAVNNEFLEVQEGLLLDMMKIIDEAGTAIAFPSHTTYHVADRAFAARPPADLAAFSRDAAGAPADDRAIAAPEGLGVVSDSPPGDAGGELRGASGPPPVAAA